MSNYPQFEKETFKENVKENVKTLYRKTIKRGNSRTGISGCMPMR